MRRIVLALVLLLTPSVTWAQCSGVFPNNYVCGNVTGANNTPRATPSTSFPAPPLAAITNNTILSNISGGTAVPVGNTLSAILDAILSSSKGSVIYRSGVGWVALTSSAGTLTNDGLGNISWGTAGTGTVTNITQGTGMVLTPSPITTTGSVAIDPSTTTGLAAGTANKVVTSDVAVAAPALVPLTPGATVTPDLNTGYNFSLSQNQSFTLANPTNITGKTGRSFCVVIRNGTSETMTLGSEYFAPGGSSTITLTGTNGALDQLCGLIYTTAEVFVTITRAYSH